MGRSLERRVERLRRGQVLLELALARWSSVVLHCGSRPMPNVSNSGNSKLRYSISGVATSAPLAAALVITIKQPDGNSGSSCSAFSGLALDTLCFRVTLPLGTSFPALRGATTNITLTFDAEQTANNPQSSAAPTSVRPVWRAVPSVRHPDTAQ